jgi:hypothetical protein
VKALRALIPTVDAEHQGLDYPDDRYCQIGE